MKGKEGNSHPTRVFVIEGPNKRTDQRKREKRESEDGYTKVS